MYNVVLHKISNTIHIVHKTEQRTLINPTLSADDILRSNRVCTNKRLSVGGPDCCKNTRESYDGRSSHGQLDTFMYLSYCICVLYHYACIIETRSYDDNGIMY